MRQRLVNIHRLWTEILKLKALFVPECLARQTGRNFTRINSQRFAVAQAMTTQRRNFLAVNVN